MSEPNAPFDLDFNPYNIPAQFLNAIGLVTVATGQTEDIIEALLAGLIGVDDFEYGLVVTLHMAMPQRFSIIRSAAEIRLDDLDTLDELDDLLDRAEKAFERRNSVVHHQWCIEPKTGRVFTVKESARRRLESDVIEMKLDELTSAAKEMYEVGLRLFLFTKKVGLLPKLPAGVRPRQHKSRSARKKRREELKKQSGDRMRDEPTKTEESGK